MNLPFRFRALLGLLCLVSLIAAPGLRAAQEVDPVAPVAPAPAVAPEAVPTLPEVPEAPITAAAEVQPPEADPAEPGMVDAAIEAALVDTGEAAVEESVAAAEARPSVDEAVSAAIAEALGSMNDLDPELRDQIEGVIREVVRDTLAATTSVDLTDGPSQRTYEYSLTPGSRHSRNERVQVAGNQELPEGETADVLVTVLGSSTNRGSVSDAQVTVLGASRMLGSVGRDYVTVLGSAEINGQVGNAVVVVGGDLLVGENARIGGEVVVIGGEITGPGAATIDERAGGEVVNVAIPFGKIFQIGGPVMRYIESNLVLLRPVSFGASFTVLLYVLITVACMLALAISGRFGRASEQVIVERPGAVFLGGFAGWFLIPAVALLLLMTLVGTLVLPFLFLQTLVWLLVGRGALLAVLGRALLRAFGNAEPNRWLSCLVGAVVIFALFWVPYLGFVTWLVVTHLAMGAGIVGTVVSLSSGKKASQPAVPPPPPAPAPSAGAIPAVPLGVAAAPVSATPAVADPASPADFGIPGPAVPPPPPAPASDAVPPPPPAATMPLAGQPPTDAQLAELGPRAGAFIIDFLLCGVLNALTGGFLPGGVLLIYVLYHLVLLSVRGTTIGGLICKVRVVRTDGKPLDHGANLVRALSSIVSLIPLGIGFLWAYREPRRRTWHDLITGTVVIRSEDDRGLL